MAMIIPPRKSRCLRGHVNEAELRLNHLYYRGRLAMANPVDLDGRAEGGVHEWATWTPKPRLSCPFSPNSSFDSVEISSADWSLLGGAGMSKYRRRKQSQKDG